MTRVIRASLTLRPLLVTLVAVAAPAPAAAATPIGTPEVRVGSVTVPSVGIPPVDVPSVSTPVASTPPVHVPSVSTPAVSTSPIRIPAVEAPPVRTPPVPAPVPAVRRPPVVARVPAASRAPVVPASIVPAVPTAGDRATGRPATTRRARVPRRAASAPPPQHLRAVTRARRRATTAVALDRPAARRDAAASSPSRDRSRPQHGGPAVDLARPSRRSLLPGAVGDIVDALPRWVLAVFLGFALIAVLMAINAYLNARRARTLGAQRAALLDDVGLLQTALLAPVPAHAGDAQVSVAYRPAAGPAAGGDFYDVLALGAHRTALVLGDVSGHGREALRHAALVRYTVRTFLAAGHDPGDALARADACLDADLEGHFATVIAAIYDHDTHTLRYAKAGHHPPVIIGTAHDPDAEPVAPPLGAGLSIRPETCAITLDPGSTVCLFTDGLIEARSHGAQLGRDTLLDLLDHGHPDGSELLDRVVDHADDVSDDLAVCLLRRPRSAG